MLAFLRRHEDETILVVVNLSRFSQAGGDSISRVLPAAARWKFSARIYFPAIRRSPYPITLGPHAHYWFVLQSPSAAARGAETRRADATIAQCRICRRFWPDRSARAISSATILAGITFGIAAGLARKRARFASCASWTSPDFAARGGARHVWFIEVNYTEGAPEIYALPVQIATR